MSQRIQADYIETFAANMGRASVGGDPPNGNGAPYRRTTGDGTYPQVEVASLVPEGADGHFEWEVGGYYALRERAFEAVR